MGTQIKVRFDLMTDRQDLIPLMETRRLGLVPYMMDRDDMYWAKVHIEDEGLKADLSYCIDALLGSGKIDWVLSKQYGPNVLDTEKVRHKVIGEWLRSTEKIKAELWVQNLVDAGYYDHGRAFSPNCNAGTCPHCNRLFERGTSHPHTYLRDWNRKGKKEIIYHHKLMEKTIKEQGLTKLSISGLPDVPSLEELGKLKVAVVE